MNKKKSAWVLLLLAFLAATFPFAGFAYDIASHNYGEIFDEVEMVDLTKDLKGTTPIGEIGPGRCIQQSFIAEERLLGSLGFVTVTYNRVNHGTMIVRLLDSDDGTELYVWTEDVSELSTGSVVLRPEPTERIYLEAGTPYSIEVTTEGATPGNAISVLVNKEDDYTAGTLVIDGKVQTGDMCFMVTGADEARSLLRSKLWMRSFAAVAVELLLCYIWVRGRKNANGASVK